MFRSGTEPDRERPYQSRIKYGHLESQLTTLRIRSNLDQLLLIKYSAINQELEASITSPVQVAIL
jgi:hypothetical protein